MDKTFWGVVSAAVEQSRRKANMGAQGDGKFGQESLEKKARPKFEFLGLEPVMVCFQGKKDLTSWVTRAHLTVVVHLGWIKCSTD